MREYDAYLFDADGTLIDTREMIVRSFVHMGEAVGVPLPAREVIEASIGLPVDRQIRELIGDTYPADLYRRAREAYGGYMMEVYHEHLRAFPGVAEGLAELARRGKKLAVVTSRRRHSLDLFLETLGIGRYFTVTATPDDTENHKPDPEPALYAMRLLGAEPANTVFIGDAEFDIRCGKAAGTDAAFVTWGGMDHRPWPVRPDFVAESFADLLPSKEG